MVQLSEEQRLQLDGIIQDMVDNGESEDNIQFVVEDFKSRQGGKTNATAEETAPVVAETPADTDLQLEDGSLESPRKSVRKQTRKGELQAKAELQEQTIANLENEYYKATKIDDVDTIKNKLSQSLKNNFDKGVFLTEQRDAYEQYKATGKLPDITDDQILKESESEFVAKERTFMENVPEYAQTALKEKLGKRKEEQEATYNQSMIEYNDNFKSHETLIANLNESVKMGVDPTEDDINTLNASLEDLKKRGSDLIAQQAELGKTEGIYDAFKRSYSDIDMLENVLAKTGVDIALGLSYTADILTAEDGKTRPHTKELINLSQELAKNKAEKLAKPIEVSNISSLSQFGEWAGDAIINFVPSGAMAMTGPAAMPLFFTSGYSGRMSEFAVNEAEAIKNIPLIKKQLEETKDPANREKLVKELDRYNKAINTGDLTKLATSITYGAGEAVFERLGTVKLVNDLKRAAKTIPAQSYSEGIIKAVGKLPSGAIIEGGTEGLTTLTQNAADILIDGQDKSITEGLDEAMAQGALIGTGFKVAEGAIIGRAAMLDVISSKEEKAQIQSTLDEISILTAELNNPEITEDRKKEIGDIINTRVKSVSENQDITSARFLRLSKEQQKEVFELDRQSRFVNKKWTATASDPSVSEASKDIIRKELEAEFNQLQQNKRNLIESADKRFKSLQLVEGLSEGDNLRNVVISETNLQKVKAHNKKAKWANKVIGLSEKDVSNMDSFLQGEESSFTTESGEVLNRAEVSNIYENQQGVDGLFDKENKNVIVFSQRAPYFNKAAAIHEYMHAAFMAKGLTQQDFDNVKNDLISHISFDAKDRLSDKQLESVLTKMQSYENKDQSEELFTAISDLINDDVIREQDKPLLSKLRDAIKSSLTAITNPGEAGNFKIDNGKQAFNFIKDFNKKIVKGKAIDLGATSQPEEKEKAKKIRIFDFDDTLAKSNSQVLYTLPDGTTGKLNATEYAKRDQELKDKGATFDFSEFSKVIDGKKGPLFEVAQKINAARGNEDLFVLTARPADAAGPIQEFLKLAGLDFKKENIIGLGDGTAQAKADWVQGKVDEGYNDFYFADDAIKNVNAVKDVLSNADVKSKVQQAKASKIAENVAFEEGSINNEFQNYTHDGKVNNAPESFQAEAAMAYEPLAQAVVNRISKVGLGVSKEQDQFIMDYLSDNQNKQDIVSDLTFGTERNKASSLLGLAKTYNPEVGSFGGYAKSQLANRAIRILEERVGKQVTQGAQTIDAPESREVIAEDQRVETADIRNVFEKLNLPKEIVAKANKLAELASIKADKALTGKDVSDLKKVNARNKAFNDIFGKQLFKDIANELGKNTKTSDAFSQFINKNYDSLKDIALENIDFQKGGGPAALWNIDNPPSKEEFLNYYEAKNEKTSTRSDRKKSLNNAIARQIGNEARIEFAKKDPATAKLFKEKHGVVLASKIVLPNNKSLQTLAGIAGFKDGAGMPASNVWKAFGAETNIGFNLSEKKGRERAIKAMEFALTKGNVPLDAFATGALMINSSPRFFKDQESAYEKAKEEYRKNPTAKNKRLKEEADKVRLKIKNDFTADMDKMIDRIKKEGKATYLTGAAKGWTKNKFSFNKNGTSIEKILESFKNGTTAANNKANLAMFEQTMQPLYNLVAKDPKMVNLVMMLTNTSNGGSNLWFRLGAEVVGSSSFLLPGKEGKRGIEWEHAMQANNARLFLLNSAINKVPWGTVYPAVKRNYKVIALDKSLDDILKAAKRGNAMGVGWDVYTGHWTERYFHPDVFVVGGIDPSTIVDINGQTLADKYKIDSAGKSVKVMASKTGAVASKVDFEPNTLGDFNEASTAYKAIFMVGSPGGGKTNVGKGLQLGRRGYKVVNQDIALEELKKAAGLPENESNYTKEQRSLRSKLGMKAVKAGKDKFQQYKNEGKGFLVDGTGASYNATTKKINELKEAGYDVYLVAAMTPKKVAIERNKARKERSLPTFVVSKSYDQVVESLAKYKQDYGDKVFELDTTTIGFGEALPQEFLDKVYNGITQTKVTNETLQNQKAFVASKVMASKTLNTDFNKMLERVKGVKAEARYSEDRANKLAGNKGKFKFFVPYSAEDYVGLIYPTLGKGKEGDRNLQWYKDNIINPFAVGIANFEKAKVESLEQWRNLKKQISKTPAKLNKEAVRGFTNEEALRVYLWNEQDVVPDTLAKKDVEALVKHVEDSKELSAFAENVKVVGSGGYPAPGNNWLSGSLTIDLIDNINTGKRTEFLQQWQDNVDVVYSKDNMNKLKALYGERYTEALENILYRMKTGRNRPSGATRLENQFMNWVNDSVGTVMFFNTRSALLQTISSVNFLNWSDNNPLMAAKAFANQPRFWKDFADLFNSDFLKSRRSGLKNDINADELAKSAATADNKVRAGLSAILKAGFLPTQIADSFAISIGGASFYRNRLNTYKKQGLSEEQAKEKAMLDFQETAEESQQSSRPDRVSMQQASSLGRVILAFANTPMQYTRLTKKAALDLVNGRGDWKTNMSKILYYGAVQNIVFTALQQAMFAMLFDDDEIDDEEQTEASTKIVNGIADTFLRGSGVGGAAVATMKNIIMEIIKQKESKRPDYTKAALKLTTLSPPIDTKIRKLMSAGRAFTYKQSLKDMNRLGVDIDNPAALATGQVLSAVANLPADRAILKMRNVKGALDTEHEAWQRIALGLGFSDWQLGIDKDKSDNDKPKIIKFTKPKSGGVKFVKPGSKKSPTKKLERGVAGRANNDGTIEIDPNLSPVEREKTIAHEEQHMKDIKAGKLNYDDNYVYWNDSKYERKNGKIKYKGKSYIEGHKDLPWEKKAYAAEPSTAEAKKRIKLYA